MRQCSLEVSLSASSIHFCTFRSAPEHESIKGVIALHDLHVFNLARSIYHVWQFQEFEIPTYSQTPISLAHLGLVRPFLATDTKIYVLKVCHLEVMKNINWPKVWLPKRPSDPQLCQKLYQTLGAYILCRCYEKHELTKLRGLRPPLRPPCKSDSLGV